MSGPVLPDGDLPARPRRLSPLTPVVRGPLFVVVVVGAMWRELLDGDLSRSALVVVAVLLAGVIFGLASWVRTTFWVERDELRIDTGVVARQSRRVRIDRIQGIDIGQPLVARLFGLAELKLDLAGVDREGSLAFLPLAEAERLRVLLLTRRDAARAQVSPETAALDGVPATAAHSPLATSLADAGRERPVARLDLGRLVASLLLSAETLALGLVGLGVLVAAVLSGNAVYLGGFLPTVGALALTLGRRLTGYYGFAVTESEAGLQVRRGLFNLDRQTVALPRVQGVVISEPLLWRPFGWAKLDVSLAGYGRLEGDEAGVGSTLLPVAPRAEVMALARHVLGGRDPDAVPQVPPPPRARWLAPVSYPRLGVGLDGALVVSRRGVFVRRLDVVPHERVQSVRQDQGPLQRRLRLVRVLVDSPPGPVRVSAEHRDPDEARAFVAQALALGARARAESADQPVAPAQPRSTWTPSVADATQENAPSPPGAVR